MSETNPNPAEPTEPEPGGGTTAQPVPDDDPEVAPLSAEPTEPEPGGKQ